MNYSPICCGRRQPPLAAARNGQIHVIWFTKLPEFDRHGPCRERLATPSLRHLNFSQALSESELMQTPLALMYTPSEFACGSALRFGGQGVSKGVTGVDRCPKQASWFSYFKENMDDMGLGVPTSWFGQGAKLTTYIAALVGVAEKSGPRVTVAEVVSAGTKGELLLVAGGGCVAWYLGAAVGSAAVATGRHAACGTRLIDVFNYAAQNRMPTPRITRQLLVHPEIYDTTRRNRRAYSQLARSLA